MAARLAAAAALRRLGHALVAHEVDDDTFDRIATQASAWEAALEVMPQRVRTSMEMTQQTFATPPAGEAQGLSFPDCIVTGKANPMGMAATAVRDGDEAVLRTTLGAAFEGAPGRAHGGAVAALFDEAMGFVLSIHATPAFTGRLSVTYRAPTPIGTELELRARLRARRGRKLHIEAEAVAAGTLVAEAEGVFVAVDPEHFAAG